MISNQTKKVPFSLNAIDDMLQNLTSFEKAYNYLLRFTKEELITILPNKLNISFTKKNCILILCKEYGFKASENFKIDNLLYKKNQRKKLNRLFTLVTYSNHLQKVKKQSFDNWVRRDYKFERNIRQLVILINDLDVSKLLSVKESPYLKYLNFKENINQSTNKEELKNFLNHRETSISEYDNELKHTVNGKKEYVFKDNEFVGEGTLNFIPKAQKVIGEH